MTGVDGCRDQFFPDKYVMGYSNETNVYRLKNIKEINIHFFFPRHFTHGFLIVNY